MNTRLVTIVTGGSRGVGRSIALKMARDTNVMVVGRTRKDLEAVCAEINASGGQADYCVGDVSWPAIADEVARKCAEKGWAIQNLICNAGIGQSSAAADFTEDVWRHMLNVNMHGTLYFMKVCLPQMVARNAGKICIISGAPKARKHYRYGLITIPIGGPAEAAPQQAPTSAVQNQPRCIFPCYEIADAVYRACSSSGL